LPELTEKLDALARADEPLSECGVFEIVLWKVNRYASIPDSVRKDMHALRKLGPREHRLGRDVLLALLDCKGVDLPMASTLLRFQVPTVFQIIDRHAYRAVFRLAYPLSQKSRPEDKAETYFKYLDELHNLADSRKVKFTDLDRILYVFDKDLNGFL